MGDFNVRLNELLMPSLFALGLGVGSALFAGECLCKLLSLLLLRRPRAPPEANRARQYRA